jgi:hypothetical protein
VSKIASKCRFYRDKFVLGIKISPWFYNTSGIFKGAFYDIKK